MTEVTQTTDLAADLAPRTGDARVVGLISVAHFVSHYYILLLPPLFAFVRAEYQVSYTELGFAIAAFNVMSALFQTPAGFLVDRVGARVVLMAGLALGGVGFALAGLVNSFWVLIAMFAVGGLANTVYHPADYAILSQRVSAERIGQAFSVHTFAGMLGSAAAPATLLFMATHIGWRGAMMVAGALGIVVAAFFLFQHEAPAARHAPPKPASKPGAASGDAASKTGWSLLLSGPILRNLFFFVLLSLGYNGIQSYSVVALGALYGTSLPVANTALSVYLLFTAFSILAGGFLATWTDRHDIVAVVGLLAGAACTVLVGAIDLGTMLLMVVMAIGGFAGGVIMPSRDMIVRSVTPEGSFGKVFGFVTTGFNFAGIIAPLIFGYLMDHGHPDAIFVVVAVCSVVAIFTVVTMPRRRAEA